jgi:hypothetical protein
MKACGEVDVQVLLVVLFYFTFVKNLLDQRTYSLSTLNISNIKSGF